MHNNTTQWVYKPKYFGVVYTKKVLRVYVGVRPLREGSHLLGISLMSVELSQGHHNNITEEPRYTLESRSYRSSGDSLAEGYLGESLFSLRLRRSAICSPPLLPADLLYTGRMNHLLWGSRPFCHWESWGRSPLWFAFSSQDFGYSISTVQHTIRHTIRHTTRHTIRQSDFAVSSELTDS